MLFGGKKSPDKTILVLDIESGSVATGLVRLSPLEAPKIFGEKRVALPVAMFRSGSQLSANVEDALKEAVRHASEVAARVRTHPATGPLGEVAEMAVFLSAPWGRPNLSEGTPDFLDGMASSVRTATEKSFGSVPLSFYTSAGAAAYGTRALFSPEPCLVCVVTGEITEMLHIDDAGVRAHATIPTGSHSLIRTLRTHGGFSEHEARSASRLPFNTPHLREPFGAAAAHFAEQFIDAARGLLQPGEVTRVRVIAPEPVGEWFARALSQSRLAEFFPEGGEVRALRPHHVMPHIAAHSATPDLRLCVNALFVDSHVNR